MKCILLAVYFLNAAQADYDGKNLVFSGQFQVEHPMGLLKAEKATLKDLQLHGNAKKESELLLEKGVSIEVTRGHTPFTLHAQRAICALPPTTLFSLFQMQELQFYDDVEISTLQDVQAIGGSAFYKAGFLTIHPAFPSLYCHLRRGQDRIDAHEIRLDLFKEELLCVHARGALAPRAGHSLHFSTQSLLWQKKTDKLHFQKDVHIEQSGQFSIDADDGLLTIQGGFEPVSLFLEGNVRLFSSRIEDKESFAIADRISFDLREQTLLLTATAPKRVLFWQDGFSLSAPEVHIKRDLLTHQETIEGKGDVHFAFDLEEKNIIEQLLSKYL